jgi:hypothetical protein
MRVRIVTADALAGFRADWIGSYSERKVIRDHGCDDRWQMRLQNVALALA